MSIKVITEDDPESALRLEQYYSFEHFDPISGDVAPLKFPICTNIVFRARQLLKNRTREQLDYALASLNWMLTQINISSHNPILQLLVDLDKRQADGEEIDQSDYTLPTEMNTLNTCMQAFDIAGQELFPDAQWHEYFAVLALGKIDLAFEFNADPEKKEPSETQFLIRAGGLAVEAMEAVSAAETLGASEAERASLINEIKELSEKVSLRNKSAAIKKHEKTNILLGELVAFYDFGKFASYAQATHEFLKTIPEARVTHLAPTNRVRTLTEGLSSIKRGKRTL